MAFIDEFHLDANGDGDAGAGVSWDWLVTDKVGLFVKLGVNGEDINPVALDVAFGAQIHGLLESRPDDVLGIGMLLTSANDTVLAGIPEELEFTLEIYYRYVTEDGNLQITPHFMIVTDPGGNAAPWADDTLIIAGVRVFVPF
jgi:carbohydrate-selective porin OprB